MFEEIDTGLYQSDIVMFHTSLERALSCIKALGYFYYQQLGNRKDVDINWYDSPETWSDPEDNNTILQFYVPLKNFSLIWRRHHCR
jgi:hypothetical protein